MYSLTGVDTDVMCIFIVYQTWLLEFYSLVYMVKNTSFWTLYIFEVGMRSVHPGGALKFRIVLSSLGIPEAWSG